MLEAERDARTALRGTDARRPILVATCGNALAGDDALGAQVARALSKGLPEGVELLDLGLGPGRLIDALADRYGLLIVDAVACAEWPLYQLIDCDVRGLSKVALLADVSEVSTHGLGIGRQLALAATLDLLPPVARVIGATGQPTQSRVAPEITGLRCVARVASRVRRRAAWALALHRRSLIVHQLADGPIS